MLIIKCHAHQTNRVFIQQVEKKNHSDAHEINDRSIAWPGADNKKTMKTCKQSQQLIKPDSIIPDSESIFFKALPCYRNSTL